MRGVMPPSVINTPPSISNMLGHRRHQTNQTSRATFLAPQNAVLVRVPPPQSAAAPLLMRLSAAPQL